MRPETGRGTAESTFLYQLSVSRRRLGYHNSIQRVTLVLFSSSTGELAIMKENFDLEQYKAVFTFK